MRLLYLALALAFAALGILFGALNPQAVTIDFYARTLSVSLGAALLLAAFTGALLGGLAMLAGVAWPLQARLRKARREQAKAPTPEPVAPVATPEMLALGADRP